MHLKAAKKLVVSACLLGRRCRYDGRSKADPRTLELLTSFEASGGEVVSVCPEELGGLGTPRPAAQLEGGDGEAVLCNEARVTTIIERSDVTSAFIRGAEMAAASAVGADTALLKARSPSCGCGSTRIDGQVAFGDGVFAALLRRQAVTVISEEDLAGEAMNQHRQALEPDP